ncbi:hypothetical protein OsI_07206 [Oryza sativa Indica Group]|uniref:Uncharacterized protein n=1 Tax=Oryza sativa subsp. indica TaxID=39946 RepID=B8AHW3_ORYSI|nr:hypothetical protein OsI_07206 [Oryza sativa Indica Group]
MAAHGCRHLRLNAASIKSLPSAMAARGSGRRGRRRRDLLTRVNSHPQVLAQCELTLNAMVLNSAVKSSSAIAVPLFPTVNHCPIYMGKPEPLPRPNC